MKKLLLALACAAAIFGAAFTGSAKASQFECQVQPYWPCTSGFGQSVTRDVLNDSASSVLWCYPQQTNGQSGAGAYGRVDPGQWRSFWSGGYQRLVCEYYSGPYPIHTFILGPG